MKHGFHRRAPQARAPGLEASEDSNMNRYSIVAGLPDHEAKIAEAIEGLFSKSKSQIAEAVDGLLFALNRLGKCRNALPAARMHALDASAAIAKVNERMEAMIFGMSFRRTARTSPAVPKPRLDSASESSIMGACPDSPSLLR